MAARVDDNLGTVYDHARTPCLGIVAESATIVSKYFPSNALRSGKKGPSPGDGKHDAAARDEFAHVRAP